MSRKQEKLMQSIPSIESRSEYGTVKVLFWGKDGIGIRSIHPLIVNRVETVVDVHLMEYADGYDYKTLSVRRYDNFQPVSQSARDKVRDMVLQLIGALLRTRPNLFREGEIIRLTNALEIVRANQATVQRELDELNAERHAIQLALDKTNLSFTDMQKCNECGKDTPLPEHEAGNGLCLNCVSLTY
jgi:hypothetical protein